MIHSLNSADISNFLQEISKFVFFNKYRCRLFLILCFEFLLRDIIVAETEKVYDSGGFISAAFLSERPLSWRCHDDIKVWLVQSQDPDVRLISQIDIVMCSFTIYQQCHTNIAGDVTPISLRYQNVHWVKERVPKLSGFSRVLLIFMKFRLFVEVP